MLPSVVLRTVEIAPAKINLGLRVIGRQEDGYHEIDSLFVPLAWADELELAVSTDGGPEVTCLCPERPELSGLENLAARAASRYLEHTSWEARLEITLHKHVWVAAGLGGGSSDAAAVLRGLDAMRARAVGSPELERLPHLELAALARELGADVPFFLAGGPQRARGIGDSLSPVTGLPALDLILLNPGTPLSTPSVYAGLGLTPGAPTLSPPLELGALHGLPRRAGSLLVNDLEPVAIRLCPAILDMKRAVLEAGALAAGMSGSGPTVYGIFPDARSAGSAADYLRKRTGFSLLVTRTASA